MVVEDATPEEEEMDDIITTQGMSELIVSNAENLAWNGTILCNSMLSPVISYFLLSLAIFPLGTPKVVFGHSKLSEIREI